MMLLLPLHVCSTLLHAYLSRSSRVGTVVMEVVVGETRGANDENEEEAIVAHHDQLHTVTHRHTDEHEKRTKKSKTRQRRVRAIVRVGSESPESSAGDVQHALWMECSP